MAARSLRAKRCTTYLGKLRALDKTMFTQLTRRYPLLRPMSVANEITVLSAVRATALFVLLPGFIVVASLLEGTWRMPANSTGLLRHYGAWCMFVTSPILLIAQGFLLAKFSIVAESIESYLTTQQTPAPLRKMVDSYVESISLRGRSSVFFFLLMLFGLLFFAANIQNTFNPYQSYGNDVFDSRQHSLGFVLTRLYLLLLWSMLYPLAIYISSQVFLAATAIARYACKNGILRINFFAADNCGGLSVFGALNIGVMATYACFAVVYLGIWLTEGSVKTVVIGAVLTIIGFFVQYRMGIYYLRDELTRERNKLLVSINERLYNEMPAVISGGQFSRDLYLLRTHLQGVRTMPYSKNSLTIENILRYIPLTASVVKYFA